MRNRRERWLSWVWFGCGTLALSCAPTSSPAVEFGSAPAVGRWLDIAAAGAAVIEPPLIDAGSLGITGPSAGTHGPAGSTGSAGRGVVSGSGSAGGGAGPAITGVAGASPAAGSGGTTDSGGSGTSGTAVTALAFDVTTSAVGGRYQPRNIGAIWIQDGAGKLVKSLEVWAAVRRRYLTRYATALAGGTVDVVASATLSSHVAHHASWNMKDRSGAPAAPGKYTLVVELTDGDMTGRSTTVDFDTSAGVQTSTPTNAPSFSSMKLQLQ